MDIEQHNLVRENNALLKVILENLEKLSDNPEQKKKENDELLDKYKNNPTK